MIVVHVLEEVIELLVGHRQASASKGRLELVEIQLAVAVLVDGSKEVLELSFRLFDP